MANRILIGAVLGVAVVLGGCTSELTNAISLEHSRDMTPYNAPPVVDGIRREIVFSELHDSNKMGLAFCPDLAGEYQCYNPDTVVDSTTEGEAGFPLRFSTEKDAQGKITGISGDSRLVSQVEDMVAFPIGEWRANQKYRKMYFYCYDNFFVLNRFPRESGVRSHQIYFTPTDSGGLRVHKTFLSDSKYVGGYGPIYCERKP